MPGRFELKPFLFRPEEPQNSRANHDWMVNWAKVRTWLENAPPIPPLDPKPRNFRLVNVHEQCVVQAPPQPFSYVCLSYVWGDTQEECVATTKTIESLQMPGSLSEPSVPKTIQDAMAACRHLGQRYLWVDRLCIIQDDDPNGEKQEQIGMMGQVYNHAFVTLAAGEGTDARHGLHGVASLKLNDEYGEFYFTKTSTWATRAWTYQEAVLSRRLILFLAQDALLEDEQAETLQTTNSIYRTNSSPVFHGQITYKEAVQRYANRNLGDQNDAVNAFSGICSHLFGPHKFGLPVTGFDDAMAWVALRCPREKRLSRGFHVFPSWSWASIKGNVSLVHNLPVVSVASWAFVETSTDGGSSLVYTKPRRAEEYKVAKHEVYVNQMHLATLACKSGWMFRIPPEVPSLENDYERFAAQFDAPGGFASTWPLYEDFWAACRGINLSDRQAQPLYFEQFTEQQRHLAAKPGRVLALSQAVTLSVKSRNQKNRDAPGADYLINRGTTSVGIGTFDDAQRIHESPTKRETQFFALSMCSSRFDSCPRSELFRSFGGDLSTFGTGFKEEWCTYFEEYRPSLQADVMNVVAIEGVPGEEGVFRRIGFGIVVLGEWDKLDRRHCSIVLE